MLSSTEKGVPGRGEADQPGRAEGKYGVLAGSRRRRLSLFAGLLAVAVAAVVLWLLYPRGQARDANLPPGLEERAEFSGGFAAAFNGERWGYIDEQYHLVIEPQFADAGPFFGGRAPVCLPESYGMKWAFIDEHGRFVTPVWFDDAAPFEGGRGWLMIGGVEFWINAEGQCVGNCSAAAVAAWELVAGSKEIAELERFVHLFPGSSLAPLARRRLELLNQMHSIESLDQRVAWIVGNAEEALRRNEVEFALWYYELGRELDPRNPVLIEGVERCRERL